MCNANVSSYFHGVSSSDSHRGVHSHPGLPCPAVPGVSGRGRRRLESRPQDGGFLNRSNSMIYSCIMIYTWKRWFNLGGAQVHTGSTNSLFCGIILHQIWSKSYFYVFKILLPTCKNFIKYIFQDEFIWRPNDVLLILMSRMNGQNVNVVEKRR